MADGGESERPRLLGLDVSPFALRTRMALGLKGVSYEYLEEDLFDKSELLLRSNPVHQKVPVLIHRGRPICESLVIAQYVDEVWDAGAAILPAEPYPRAIARFWAAYIDDKLFPAWVAVMKAATPEARAERLEETHAVLKQLEEALAGKPFFGGDGIGYVDMALGCFFPWFGALSLMFGVEIIDAGKAPQLAAWAERFGETAVAKELLPEPEKAVEYAKKLQGKWAAAAAAAN